MKIAQTTKTYLLLGDHQAEVHVTGVCSKSTHRGPHHVQATVYSKVQTLTGTKNILTSVCQLNYELY